MPVHRIHHPLLKMTPSAACGPASFAPAQRANKHEFLTEPYRLCQRRRWITELAERFQAHVLDSRFGNTETVRAAHYLQTTEEHYDRAVQPAKESTPEKWGQKRGQKRGLNRGLSQSATIRSDQRSEGRQATGPRKTSTHRDTNKKDASHCEKRRMARVGLEPTRPGGQGILSPQRLPIPPPGQALYNKHL